LIAVSRGTDLGGWPPLADTAKLRIRVSQLRDRLSEHRPMIHGLLRADFEPLADRPERTHFRNVEKHFDRVILSTAHAKSSLAVLSFMPPAPRRKPISLSGR